MTGPSMSRARVSTIWRRGTAVLGLLVHWQVPGHWQHVHVEVDEAYLDTPILGG